MEPITCFHTGLRTLLLSVPEEIGRKYSEQSPVSIPSLQEPFENQACKKSLPWSSWLIFSSSKNDLTLFFPWAIPSKLLSLPTMACVSLFCSVSQTEEWICTALQGPVPALALSVLLFSVLSLPDRTAKTDSQSGCSQSSFQKEIGLLLFWTWLLWDAAINDPCQFSR